MPCKDACHQADAYADAYANGCPAEGDLAKWKGVCYIVIFVIIKVFVISLFLSSKGLLGKGCPAKGHPAEGRLLFCYFCHGEEEIADEDAAANVSS